MKLKNYLLLLLVLLISACQIKDFVMPSWDVILNIPLIKNKYYISDLADSVNFFLSPDNHIYAEINNEVETEPVGEFEMDIYFSSGSIPLQSGIDYNDVIPLNDPTSNLQISYGLIHSGSFQFKFSNIVPQTEEIAFSFPTIKSISNKPLTIHFEGNEDWQTVDLAGFHLGEVGSDIFIPEIEFQIVASSSLPNGSVLGSLNLEFDSEITFSRIRGVLDDFQIPLAGDETHISISYPYGLDDAIELVDATILMKITNPVDFRCKFFGDFYAVNSLTGKTATIPIVDENNQQYIINQGTTAHPTITEHIFHNQVNKLLRIMPDTVRIVNGYFLIENTMGEIGEVQSNNYLQINYTINTPFHFIVHNALIIPKDTLEVEISDENRDIIRENIRAAAMELKILNKLPIGAEIKLYFSTSPEIEPLNSDSWLFVKRAYLQSSSVSSNEQIIPLELTASEMQIFSNPKVFLKLSFLFDASDGTAMITATPADFIQVRSMIEINVHVK